MLGQGVSERHDYCGQGLLQCKQLLMPYQTLQHLFGSLGCSQQSDWSEGQISAETNASKHPPVHTRYGGPPSRLLAICIFMALAPIPPSADTEKWVSGFHLHPDSRHRVLGFTYRDRIS